MDDPWKSLGISRTKDIALTFIHTNADTANREFAQSIKEIASQSPYFEHPIHDLKHFRLQVEGTRNTKSLGTDTIFYILSEVNFWKPSWVAKDKMDTALGRYTSRFLKWQHYNGGIIFDTSAKGDAAIMEKFVKENALGDKILVVRASQWEVKGSERGGFFKEGGFWVYAGDSLKSPFILSDDQTPEMLSKEMNYDKDRFIYAPKELYAEFKSDIVKALNDKAGYSTHSTGKFFEDPAMITQCVTLPKMNDDSIAVDFYDTEDKLIYKLQGAVASIDPNMPCYIHIDMGYVSDLCGFSLIQFKEWVFYDNDKRTKMPSFTAPITVGISRLSGQETSALHLYDLIMELSKKYEVASVSYDSHQTRPIVQELTRAGVDTRYLSVDRTTEPYIVLKNLMGRKLVEIPDNEILVRELSELKYEGTDKIDHPSGCLTGDTRIKVISKKDHLMSTISMLNLVRNYQDYLVCTSSGVSNIKYAWRTKVTTEIVELEFDDGFKFRCTYDHPILTDSDGYKDAMELTCNYLCNGKRLRYKVPLALDEPLPVYDLCTEADDHNFELGNGVLVHNSSKDISDSLCGAIYNAYTNLDMASEPSQKTFAAKTQTKLLDYAMNSLNPSQGFFRDKAANIFK